LTDKLSKQARDVIEFGSLIKLCLIQRLTTFECRELFEKNGHNISEATWFRLKKEYNQGTNKRFLEIAKHEWADEHLLILDKFKWIEQQYHKVLSNCEEPRDMKAVLDSLCKVQEQIALFYDDTPLMSKMKETLEAKLQELTDAKGKKKSTRK
jgi:hypothetical protein